MNPEKAAQSAHSFREDYDAVAALVRRSWSTNKDQSLLYTREFLENSFTYPGTQVNLAATLYKEDQPIAFVAAFPRTVRIRGEVFNLALNTFLTVEPAYAGKAYGAAIWSECVNRVRASGYDGTVNFCVDGGPTNGIVQVCGQRLGFRTERVFSTTYLARLLRSGMKADVEDLAGADIELFLKLAGSVTTPPMVRIWSVAEAEWQCSDRYGALCVRHESGPRRGLLTGYVMEVVGGGTCLAVEDLFWGSLEGTERVHLAEKLLHAGAAAGAEIAVVPRMGYADEWPLVECGFRKSRRVVHTYLTLWRSGRFAGPVESQYIDIF